jgi:hypothetical protein
VFADWLEEHGEHDRAEFIRVQAELEPMRDQYEVPRAAELHRREDTFLQDKGKTWLADLPEGRDDWQAGVSTEFRRGFPDRLHCPARSFLTFGPAIRGRHPTIRRVVIHCLNGWGERLAACDGLEGLAELELACWYADEDMQALAASPHLAELQVLVLWLGRQSGTDADLCRLAARAKAWPNLRELVLLDPEGESEKAIKRLAASANRSSRRKIARYERGYPELFPLDSMFYYDFPVAGRLPDGRAAVAEFDLGPDDHHRDAVPAGLAVRTFDADGAPTGEVIRVPLPPELANVNLGDAKNWDGQYTKQLRDVIGFEPGFIRVQANALGDDFGPRRGHYDNWDLCGAADDPEDPTGRNGDPDPNGAGGRIYHYVRNVEFVVGYHAWADKRGHVHST